MSAFKKFVLAGSAIALFATAPATAQIAPTLPSEAAGRLAEAKSIVHTIARGQVLAIEAVRPAPGKPTLLMMPGVNRALRLDDVSLKSLVAEGFGVVAYNMSAQPLSIALLPDGERANLVSTPTLESLAREAEIAAKRVGQEMGLTGLVPVSLSYTGAVSPFLKGQPLVIETVPMTSSDDANPKLGAYRRQLRAGEIWNPIFGPGITRSLLDQAYGMVWEKQVTDISKQYSLPSSRHREMVEGYTSLSRAVEGFDWTQVKRLPMETRRIFILAGDEGQELFRNQVETFKRVRKETEGALLIVIGESGHIIPADQPVAYAKILSRIFANEFNGADVVLYTPSTNETLKASGQKADNVIEALLGRGGGGSGSGGTR